MNNFLFRADVPKKAFKQPIETQKQSASTCKEHAITNINDMLNTEQQKTISAFYRVVTVIVGSDTGKTVVS